MEISKTVYLFMQWLHKFIHFFRSHDWTFRFRELGFWVRVFLALILIDKPFSFPFFCPYFEYI